jgi:hypothetical protein
VGNTAFQSVGNPVLSVFGELKNPPPDPAIRDILRGYANIVLVERTLGNADGEVVRAQLDRLS